MRAPQALPAYASEPLHAVLATIGVASIPFFESSCKAWARSRYTLSHEVLCRTVSQKSDNFRTVMDPARLFPGPFGRPNFTPAFFLAASASFVRSDTRSLSISLTSPKITITTFELSESSIVHEPFMECSVIWCSLQYSTTSMICRRDLANRLSSAVITTSPGLSCWSTFPSSLLFPIDGTAHSFFDPGHATKALLVGKVEDLVFAIRQILISGGNSEIADYSHLILLLFVCACSNM